MHNIVKNRAWQLLAIDHLKRQKQYLQNPCIALLISRQYRLLANSVFEKEQQENYALNARLWLRLYINHYQHSKKMRHQLHKLMLLDELNQSI